jgi:general secretion pathway protein N
MRNGLIRNLPRFGLAAALALTAAPLRADDAAPSGRAQNHATTLDNPLAAHSLDEFTATRDRPLFTRGRRPPAVAHAVPAVAAPPPPAPPPQLALFGILVEAGEASAVVRGAPSEKVIHVRVGDQIDGWEVSQIAERQIVLSQDDRSVAFTMFDSSHAATPTDVNHMPPVVEVNAAGVLRAHRVTRIHH